MSDQETVAANVGTMPVVGLPRPTRFVNVISAAIQSYPGHGGPGIQLGAWVTNAISAYFNAYPDQVDSPDGADAPAGGDGENLGALRLTNLGIAVERGLEKWNAGHQQIGPSQANYVADSVISWLQDTY
jgi:hypothetical protein